jgi:hypothetical protein
MRFVGAAAICVIALCGIDAYWFGGTYFEAVRGIADQIKHHFWLFEVTSVSVRIRRHNQARRHIIPKCRFGA